MASQQIPKEVVVDNVNNPDEELAIDANVLGIIVVPTARPASNRCPDA